MPLSRTGVYFAGIGIGGALGAAVTLGVVGATSQTPPLIGIYFDNPEAADILRKSGALPQNALDRACKDAITKWRTTGAPQVAVAKLSSRAASPQP